MGGNLSRCLKRIQFSPA
uniref:Uncharacterized protein n=1 Tax=Anguilla anguilla TaxID=7936 RepID=A0A0E9PHV5_ANGAN